MNYIKDPTVGHDCSLQELKQGVITADVKSRGTMKHLDYEGKSFVWVEVMKYGYMRRYPSTRITSDRQIAIAHRGRILKNYS